MRTAGLLAAVLLSAGLAGCLAVNTSNNRMSGKKVTAEQLAEVKPGATKENVADLLGPPSSRMDLGSGLDVWEWNYSQSQNQTTGFIFIFLSDHTTTENGTVSVEFKDGVVVKTWSKTTPQTAAAAK